MMNILSIFRFVLPFLCISFPLMIHSQTRAQQDSMIAEMQPIFTKIHDRKIQRVFPRYKEYSVIYSHSKYGLFSKSEMLFPAIFDYASCTFHYPVEDNPQIVLGINSHHGVYDIQKKEWILELKYRKVMLLSDLDRYIVQDFAEKWFVLDAQGNKIYEFETGMQSMGKTIGNIAPFENRNIHALFDVEELVFIKQADFWLDPRKFRNVFFLNEGPKASLFFKSGLEIPLPYGEKSMDLIKIGRDRTVIGIRLSEGYELYSDSGGKILSGDLLKVEGLQWNRNKGYVFMSRDSLYGLWDKSFKEILPADYEDIRHFSDRLYYKSEGRYKCGKWQEDEIVESHLIDLDKVSDIVTPLYKHLLVKKKNGSHSIMDTLGQLHFECDTVINLGNNYLVITPQEIIKVDQNLNVLSRKDFNIPKDLKLNYPKNHLSASLLYYKDDEGNRFIYNIETEVLRPRLDFKRTNWGDKPKAIVFNQNGKRGICTYDSEVLVNAEYDFISESKERIIGFKKDELYKLVPSVDSLSGKTSYVERPLLQDITLYNNVLQKDHSDIDDVLNDPAIQFRNLEYGYRTFSSKLGSHPNYVGLEKDGKIILPMIFKNESHRSIDKIILSHDRHFGLFNLKSGKWELPMEYSFISKSNHDNVYSFGRHGRKGTIYFSYPLQIESYDWEITGSNLPSGYLMVKDSQTEKIGVFNYNIKKVIIPLEYDELSYRDTRFLAVKEGKCTWIDINNTPRLDQWYDEIRQIYRSDNYFVKKDGFYGIMDMTGRLVYPFDIKEIGYNGYDSGIYWCKNQHDKWGSITTEGKLVEPFTYDNINTQTGIFKISKNYKWGIYNNIHNKDLEKFMVPIEYDQIVKLGDFISIQQNGKWGLLDRRGNEIFPCKWDKIEEIETSGKDVYSLANEQEAIILNHLGDVISDKEYANFTSVPYPNKNYIIVKDRKGKYGLIDNLGVTIIAPQYEQLTVVSQNLMIVRENNYCRLYNIRSSTYEIENLYDQLIKARQGFIGIKGNGFFEISEEAGYDVKAW